jgi:hypothetical protein
MLRLTVPHPLQLALAAQARQPAAVAAPTQRVTLALTQSPSGAVTVPIGEIPPPDAERLAAEVMRARAERMNAAIALGGLLTGAGVGMYLVLRCTTTPASAKKDEADEAETPPSTDD